MVLIKIRLSVLRYGYLSCSVFFAIPKGQVKSVKDKKKKMPWSKLRFTKFQVGPALSLRLLFSAGIE